MRYEISDTEVHHPEKVGGYSFFITTVTVGNRHYKIYQSGNQAKDLLKNFTHVVTWVRSEPKSNDIGGMGKPFRSMGMVTKHYRLLTTDILDEVMMQHFEAIGNTPKNSKGIKSPSINPRDSMVGRAPEIDTRGSGRFSEKSYNIWESYDSGVMGIQATYQNKMMDSYIDLAMNDNLGYKREDNAQINDVEYTKNHLVENWNAKPRRMKISSLKASQNEYSKEKVEGMMIAEEFDPFNHTYFVSEDKRLLDGHHSWIYGMSVDENQYVDVIKVPLTFNKTKKILHHLKNTDRKSVSESKNVTFEKWIGDDFYNLTKGIENSIDEKELVKHLVKYAKEVAQISSNSIKKDAQNFVDSEDLSELLKIASEIDDITTTFEVNIDELEDFSNEFLNTLT